jgi:hypothetical protein
LLFIWPLFSFLFYFCGCSLSCGFWPCTKKSNFGGFCESALAYFVHQKNNNKKPTAAEEASEKIFFCLVHYHQLLHTTETNKVLYKLLASSTLFSPPSSHILSTKPHHELPNNL